MTRQQSCEERIEKELESTLDSFRSTLRVYGHATNMSSWEESYGEATDEDAEQVINIRGATLAGHSKDELEEAALERWEHAPIGIAVERVVKIELSWGGPADFFRCWVDEHGHIERITYHFQDWFDGAEREVTGDDFDLAKDWLSRFTEIAVIA